MSKPIINSLPAKTIVKVTRLSASGSSVHRGFWVRGPLILGLQIGEPIAIDRGAGSVSDYLNDTFLLTTPLVKISRRSGVYYAYTRNGSTYRVEVVAP